MGDEACFEGGEAVFVVGAIVVEEEEEDRGPILLLLFASVVLFELAVPEDELETSRERTPSPSDSASELFALEVAPAYSLSDWEALLPCRFHGRL